MSYFAPNIFLYKINTYEKWNISEPSHETEWVDECKCVPLSECIVDENDSSIDIRIITVLLKYILYILY